MTEYKRRDFLKSLVATAAAAAGIPVVSKLANSKVVARMPQRVFFPWDFFGETELLPHTEGMEHARLYALKTEAPPKGHRFFLRSVSIRVREDARLEDLKRFLDTWSIEINCGDKPLAEMPSSWMMSGWGIGDAAGAGGTTPIWPELPIAPGLPLSVAFHGKPFALTGEKIVAQCHLAGVGTIA